MATVSQDPATIRHLRVGIGLLGIALPLALSIGYALEVGKAVLLSSLSGSYYTGMRDVFVGSLCAIGVFLIFYRYSPLDDILGTIAGLAAITTALFPTRNRDGQILVSAADSPSGIVHGVAAVALFLMMAIFCFFSFPRSTVMMTLSARKKARNVIYYICGVAIIVGLLLATVGSKILPDSIVDSLRPMFWGETIAVVAFGVAWLAKSNTIFKDVEA